LLKLEKNEILPIAKNAEMERLMIRSLMYVELRFHFAEIKRENMFFFFFYCNDILIGQKFNKVV
jgi:hypothetical protein